MKEQFFADQRDYFKYSILRHLLGQGLGCTVCWLMTPDVEGGACRLRDYLEDEINWRNLDPAVFDYLRGQVNPGPPVICSVIDPGISPIANCCFHWEYLPLQEIEREAYFDRCMHIAKGSQLVFVDPNTGPMPACGRVKEPQNYIRWEEIARIYNSGYSVLLFHFLQLDARQRVIQVRNNRNRLQQKLPTAIVHALRTEDIAFYFAVQGDHNRQVQLATDNIIQDWMGPLLRRAP